MKGTRSFGTVSNTLVFATSLIVGCGSTTSGTSSAPGEDPSSQDAGAGGTSDDASSTSSSCPVCTTDQDCDGHRRCMQLAGDSYCAPECVNGTDCAADRSCVSANSVGGERIAVCVPRADVCTPTPPADAGSTGPSGGPVDAGAPVTGTIDGSGGTLSRLLFGIVGDTRPPVIEDTKGYPTKIITQIYTRIEALDPKPAFVVSTGDYMFAKPNGSQASPQLDMYLQARKVFSGVLFPAMGNHECTGATTSNCGPGTTNGATNNYTSFMDKLLGPIQKSEPYYSVNVKATDASWTAKFVFVAANAWTQAQSNWLDQTLSQPTTYTFIVRHESHSANTAPGVKPSEQIMAHHPYTLAIVGHTHTYEHFSGREVIVGNGGAPLTGGKNYGFGLVSQRPDGALQVDMIDYASGATDGSFRFAVHPDGSPAP